MSVADQTPGSARDQQCWKIARTTDEVRVALLAFGLYQVAVGLFMTVAPGMFFDLLGPFGGRNDHYIRDLAAFELPLGIALLVAVRLRSWRVPVLAFAALHWTLHALSHLADIGAATPSWIGPADLLAVSAGATVLVWVLSRAVRAERWDSA